jgi:MoxR-like ATPase
MAADWKIFQGLNADGTSPAPHAGVQERLPPPPPWRRGAHTGSAVLPDRKPEFFDAEKARALPFRPTREMILAVNTALYLRRPLLLTGKPGTGKSTLIAKVATELMLGPVLRWPITSRTTVRSGVYEYDAVGRLQASAPGQPPPDVSDYLTLGPLGTALAAHTWPRPLLIDEIDKSDLDFANDLLNVIEEGSYEIPELRRLGGRDTDAGQRHAVTIRDWLGEPVTITDGRLECGQFPFVVMTSNAEREFPPPFLRRCIRLTIQPPSEQELAAIVDSHLRSYLSEAQQAEVQALVHRFFEDGKTQELATDQLLNAVFLTIGMNDGRERTLAAHELGQVRENLLKQLTTAQAT